MKPTLIFLALFIGWTLPAADRPGGKLTVKRDIQYYDIRGRTPNELRKALDAQGPLNPVGKNGSTPARIGRCSGLTNGTASSRNKRAFFGSANGRWM
jgi:hypothetical protein